MQENLMASPIRHDTCSRLWMMPSPQRAHRGKAPIFALPPLLPTVHRCRRKGEARLIALESQARPLAEETPPSGGGKGGGEARKAAANPSRMCESVKKTCAIFIFIFIFLVFHPGAGGEAGREKTSGQGRRERRRERERWRVARRRTHLHLGHRRQASRTRGPAAAAASRRLHMEDMANDG